MGLTALVLTMPFPGTAHGSLLGGMLDVSRMRELEVEMAKAGLPLPLEQKSHISPDAGNVLCVVDVAQSIGRIMGVGNSIKSVTVNCDFKSIVKVQRRPITQDERQRCAVTIFGAANVNAFIGNVLVLAGTAMAADLSCPLDPLPDRIEERQIELQEARDDLQREINKFLIRNNQPVTNVLPPDPAIPKDEVFHSISRCVAHLDLAVTFVMKSGVIIADSTLDCSEEELIDEDDKRVCAINIIGLMGTLSLATRFFALASNSCVQIVGQTTHRAGCAADTAGINAGVYASVAPAMNLQASCIEAYETWDPDMWPRRKDLRQSATKQGPKKRLVDLQPPGYVVIADT